MKKLRVGVLISGRGSNLKALIDATNIENYPAEIVYVISNNPNALGLNHAKEFNIPYHVIDHKKYANREEFDRAMHQKLIEAGVEFICLAGFMRLLTPWFVSQWPNKIINIHPSLLPSFKGSDSHKQAIEAGVRISGCTIHFVSAEMDSGPIILQAVVPVYQDDTEKTLAARVLLKEHESYPFALKLIALGKVEIKSSKVFVGD